MELRDLQSQIHQTAVEHGWWEPQVQKVRSLDVNERGEDSEFDACVQRTFGDMVALCHSELSEALEAFRDRGIEEWIEDSGKPEGAFTELGDCIIRILDMAGFYGVDMQAIIESKMAYNNTREYRHGNKKL